MELLRQKGLKLVTLEEAQRDPIYQLDPDAPSPGRNLLEQWMDVRAIKYPPVTPKSSRPIARLSAAVCYGDDFYTFNAPDWREHVARRTL